MTTIRTVKDLLSSYTVVLDASPTQRLANFLNVAAEVLPKAFIDKRICAKVAFARKQTPSETHDDVHKIGNINQGVAKLLIKEYNRTLITDRAEGWRASYNEDDKVLNTHRRARQRIDSAFKSYDRVDKAIDQAKVSAALKKELTTTRKAFGAFNDFWKSVPLLPPGKDKE